MMTSRERRRGGRVAIAERREAQFRALGKFGGVKATLAQAATRWLAERQDRVLSPTSDGAAYAALFTNGTQLRTEVT